MFSYTISGVLRKNSVQCITETQRGRIACERSVLRVCGGM
jgi:hypothetical protein